MKFRKNDRKNDQKTTDLLWRSQKGLCFICRVELAWKFTPSEPSRFKFGTLTSRAEPSRTWQCHDLKFSEVPMFYMSSGAELAQGKCCYESSRAQIKSVSTRAETVPVPTTSQYATRAICKLIPLEIRTVEETDEELSDSMPENSKTSKNKVQCRMTMIQKLQYQPRHKGPQGRQRKLRAKEPNNERGGACLNSNSRQFRVILVYFSTYVILLCLICLSYVYFHCCQYIIRQTTHLKNEENN